ncbi:MAG: amino acid adenylation domain-containing protein, partial [Lachnospiraceae bacterium]|nr:amino acid adenylation domain-containing protein [Lachnospiraceae bacterium]
MKVLQEENALFTPLYAEGIEKKKWQIDENSLKKQEEFWLSKFETELPKLNMPHKDVNMAMVKDNKSGQAMRRIDEKLGGQIKERFSDRDDRRAFFGAAVVLLLGKYTNQEDLVIGTIAGGHEDCNPVNYLALRGTPEHSKMISVFMSEMKEIFREVWENQDYPYEELIRRLKENKSIIDDSLFDVMFVMKYAESGSDSGIQDTAYISEYDIEPELIFEVEEGAENFAVRIRYSHILYSEETAQRMLEHLENIFRQAITNPDVLIGDLEIITDGEKEMILNRFNRVEEYPNDKTVAELIEEQAAKVPDKTAIVFREECLSYEQYNGKANYLAKKLRDMGVKPNDVVALYTERSMELLIAVLGVLKAGAAYLPIDTGYPEERVQFILHDAAPKALITYRTKVTAEIPVIDLTDGKALNGTADNLENVKKEDDLLYCVYTSGTTGNPKGTIVTERTIVNYFYELQAKTCKSLFARVLINVNYAYALSVHDILYTFMSGGCGYLITDEDKKDTKKCADFIKKAGVNTIATTPSYFDVLVSDYKDCMIGTLEHIILAGEKFKVSNVLAKDDRAKDIMIYNEYGQTETFVVSMTKGTAGELDSRPKNNIGAPTANMKLLVMDGMKLAGIGQIGEICVINKGSKGYRNNPEMSAEKFVDNPFGEGKLFRTGDLGRWLPDGTIRFAGRNDEQVKIRGFRVEIGEIENKIRKLDGINDCVIVAKPEADGNLALFAYLVSKRNLSIPEIREKLAISLPDYMIPAYMMQIESIPVTRNGKLDRRALPEIEVKSGKTYEAPRNETEEMICRIFTEILGAERVGIKDSFFELGGHSLRATKLVNRIEAESGKRIELKDVFANPTPEKLSELIGEESTKEYIPIPRAEKKEYYPMSSAQKRIYLTCQMDSDGVLYNIPQSFRLTGEIQPERLKNAFQCIIDRHEILRTVFLSVNGELVQSVLDRVEAEFICIQDTQTPEDELISGFVRPFDLGKAPLVRAQLVKREKNWLFSIDIHHIVGDGMTIGNFLKELSALYNGEALGELSHQFKDYSEWMAGRDLSGQAEYWKKQFEDEIPVLDMPLDYARPQEQSFKGGLIRSRICKELSYKIKSLATATGTTEYMIMLSAMMVLLAKYSRQEDIVVGSGISARTHKDTEGMLGMFVNTLAMRGKPEGKKSFREFLEEIKESCLRAYENQEYPFEELVNAVCGKRDLSRNPLFDVMLVLQNNEQVLLELHEAEVEEVEYHDQSAKFDLTFSITEQKNEYHIDLEYCTALYKMESAEQLAEHLITVLEEVTEQPQMLISEIGTAGSREKELILGAFNDTAAEYPKDKTVAELFEEQVRKTPERTAVVFEEKSLTYRQMDAKAGSLAKKLQDLGVEAEDFVAVIAGKSLEIVLGILGIVKAGGAYVPIDPGYPEDRIRFMIEDCSPKAVLVYDAKEAEEGVRKNFPKLPVIDLADGAVFEGEAGELKHTGNPGSAIYCIYTSGTTGQPKGVVVEHRNVVKLVKNCDYTELNEDSVILQTGQMMFDASTFEVWGAFLNGGCLHLIRQEKMLDAKTFKAYMEEKGVNTLFITTALFNQFLNEDRTIFNCLEHLMFGGEATSERHVEMLRSQQTGLDFRNVYGPTETTTFAAHYIIRGKAEKTPIGKPISNTQMYVLDGEKLCGIGVPGELCIAGDGVARGYLNREELTAQKFVKNPYGEGKMYRSGDLVRWLPDGNIEFLGRIDEQVKIRGFRIELGEIASRIRETGGVKDCAVIVRQDGAGEKAVYAYLVGEDGRELDLAEIREKLSESMPDYMIPSRMMQLEQ